MPSSSSSSSSFQLEVEEVEFPSPLPDLPDDYFTKIEESLAPERVTQPDAFLERHLPADLVYIHPHMMNEIITRAIELGITSTFEYSDAPRTPNTPIASPRIDMTAEACPKCKGTRYIHTGTKKHDKSTGSKCKHCVSCQGCGGIGQVIGKKPCDDCNCTSHSHFCIQLIDNSDWILASLN